MYASSARLLVLGLSVTLLGACSTWGKREPVAITPVHTVTNVALADRGVGVADVGPYEGTVYQPRDTQHVLSNNGQTFSYRLPNDRQQGAAISASQARAIPSPHVATAQRPRGVWERYCAGEQLSPEEFRYVLSRPIPNEIEDCRPIK